MNEQNYFKIDMKYTPRLQKLYWSWFPVRKLSTCEISSSWRNPSSPQCFNFAKNELNNGLYNNNVLWAIQWACSLVHRSPVEGLSNSRLFNKFLWHQDDFNMHEIRKFLLKIFWVLTFLVILTWCLILKLFCSPTCANWIWTLYVCRQVSPRHLI